VARSPLWASPSCSGGSYDFRERLLTDFRNYSLLPPFLTKIRHQKKHSRKTLFAGIEKLIDQILLYASVSRQDVRQEYLG
jgi:hypothetical protein